MENKDKIYDIIFFYNEHNLLNLRLKYLSDVVDGFLILNFGPQDLELEGYNLKVLKIEENFFEYFNYDDMDFVKRNLLDFGVKFTDTIMFSKVNEIPNKEDFLEFKKQLKKGGFILKQKNYFWNHHYQSLTIHMGSCVMLLTHLAQDYKILHKLWETEYPLFLGQNNFNSGWHFNGFENDMDVFTKSFSYWNQIKTPLSHIREKLELSKNEMKEFWIKKHPKKIFLVSGDELPKIFYNDNQMVTQITKTILVKMEDIITPISQYDEVFEINVGKINHINHKVYTIETPQNAWYQKDLDPQIDYTKNEILRIFNELQLHDSDKIYIIKKTDNNPSVYDLGEFKKLIPSECI
jgi:uncharacterized protein YsxB (DUF464 family)